MIAQVADSGSVSEAASHIGVTQSALSHRIKEAERLLNTILFYRENKKLMPTNAGKRLLAAARVVLGEIERAENDIDKLSEGIEHVVRLGLETYCNYSWLPGFLKRFEQNYPAVGVEVIADVSQNPYAALRKGLIDLSIVSGIVHPGTLKATRLFEDEMIAVVPKGHRLSKEKCLMPEDFEKETYIAYHTNPERGREYEQFFSRYQILPRKVIRAGVTEAVIAFVAAGQGISILPRWTIKPYLDKYTISAVPLTEKGLPLEWHALTRMLDQADSPANLFVQALQLEDLQSL